MPPCSAGELEYQWNEGFRENRESLMALKKVKKYKIKRSTGSDCVCMGVCVRGWVFL